MSASVIYLITLPLITLSVYWINKAFLGNLIKSKNIEIRAYIIYTILLFILSLFFFSPIYFLIYNLITFYFLSQLYEANKLNCLLHSIKIYSILMVLEVIVSTFFFNMNFNLFEGTIIDDNIYFIIARIITISVSYFIYLISKDKFNKIPLPYYYYISYISVLVGTLYLFVKVLQNPNLTTFEITFCGIIVIVSNVMVILLDNKTYDFIVMKYEYDIIKNENLSYENQKEIINQSLSTIKSIKHDMTNQIIVLRKLYEDKNDEEFNKYISKMLTEIKDNSNLINSNNFVVDSILNFKLMDIINSEVDIKLNFNIPKDLKISSFDLTTILGNLIDNSINAINQSEHKSLKLSINHNKGNLIILIDNSYNGQLHIENGKLKTTKSTPKNQGIGLDNIRNTVTKYNGQIDIDYTNDIFSVAILIPD